MQKIRVIDFETTGTPEDAVKAVCEVGWTDVTADWAISAPQSFLVNPGHPIPAVTRAVHHISDADVVGAVDPGTAMLRLSEGMGPDDIFAAHNAAFEQAFFAGCGRRWICTMKCAQHLLPDAPRHSNQVLRYWLDVDPEFADPSYAMPMHRAGPDTYVTAHILTRLLFISNPDELVRLTTAPVVLQTITFGKHRGSKWADLPSDYLAWIVNKSDLGSDEKHTARHFLGAR
ncbi:exonuclease domain-containing protein [Pararhizobium sp.]|uniref:exonuclease domain-containing protein n=1 Tax=Pararhizobium sp. TaxID=1977563 RepID=UPI002722DB52|nr:exonuclease domain-containing protein [Pararhizobium sp.]MDO9416987.1 DUF3820 family protein [Pararhizobium sp.]